MRTITRTIVDTYYNIQDIRERFPDKFEVLFNFWKEHKIVCVKQSIEVFDNEHNLDKIGFDIRSIRSDSRCSESGYQFIGSWYNKRIKAKFKPALYNEEIANHYNHISFLIPDGTHIELIKGGTKFVKIAGVAKPKGYLTTPEEEGMLNAFNNYVRACLKFYKQKAEEKKVGLVVSPTVEEYIDAMGKTEWMEEEFGLGKDEDNSDDWDSAIDEADRADRKRWRDW